MRIHLPAKAIAAGKQAGQPTDVFYAFKLLEKSGTTKFLVYRKEN